MHRLEITGETPEALYINVVNTLAMFLRGPAQTTPAPEAAVSRTSDPATSEQEVIPPGQDPVEKVIAKKRGKKPSEPIKVEGNLNDDISNLAAAGDPPKELTLADDIIPRLMAIQAAHTKRGNDMPTCVKYIQKLYGPFGIANAKNLKPEQFAEFMEASEAYLSGEA